MNKLTRPSLLLSPVELPLGTLGLALIGLLSFELTELELSLLDGLVLLVEEEPEVAGVCAPVDEELERPLEPPVKLLPELDEEGPDGAVGVGVGVGVGAGAGAGVEVPMVHVAPAGDAMQVVLVVVLVVHVAVPGEATQVGGF